MRRRVIEALDERGRSGRDWVEVFRNVAEIHDSMTLLPSHQRSAEGNPQLGFGSWILRRNTVQAAHPYGSL